MRAPGTLIALVVEDEMLIRIDIVEEFRSKGWNVLESHSGEEALDLACDQHVDVVFTDIELSGHLKGWDVAERLRDRISGLAVIYTSGKSVDRDRQAVGSLFFAKPYASTEVVQACEKLVCDLRAQEFFAKGRGST